MTPKEKATWIVHQMYGALFHTNSEPAHVKQCALIAVDEITNVVKKYETEKGRLLIDNIKLDYWQEVKQEIDKL